MAINDFFKNPFGNAFNNGLGNAFGNLATLRPRVRDENATNAEKVDNKKVDEKKDSNFNSKNALQGLQNQLANKLLGSLTNFGLQMPENMGLSQNKDLSQSLQNAIKEGGAISQASSIEIQESITYTLSFDSKSGEYKQSIQYSSTFVANFNAEIVDKNGNKVQVQNKIALGERFEGQITGGDKNASKSLKEFLEGQNFKLDFDGDLKQMPKDGLNNGVYFMEIGEAFNNIFKEAQEQNKALQNEVADIFNNLQKALNSTLEAFVGTKDSNNSDLNINAMLPNGEIADSFGARKINNAEIFLQSTSLSYLKIEA